MPPPLSVFRLSGNLASVVYGNRRAEPSFWQCSQLTHRPPLPQEGMPLVSTRQCPSHNLTVIIDGISSTCRAAAGDTQIMHDTALP